MRVLLVVEVEAFRSLLDSDSLLVGLVLENQLFEEQERALVDDPLAHLHLAGPRVRRPRLLAIVALRILNHEFNAERLLQHRVVLHFLLHSQLELDAARVRLRPDELGVEQLYFFEALHVLEADGQQF